MADNSTLDPGAGGDVIRDKDRTGVKTQIVGIDLNIGGAESLMAGAMPVTDNGGNLSIDDGGNSITVDGTVTANAGTGPFPVSDNAGSLTVDAAAASFANNQAQVAGTAVSVNSGAKDAGTQRVILASDQTVVPVSDNAGSLTVDAPVTTPAFVRLSDGAAAITALPVTDNAGSLTVDSTQLPAALAANGGIKVEGVAGGVVVPVSGTVTANAGSGPFPVSDNAGSLTVDAPVGTPAFVRLSDGASAITALPVTDNAGSLTVDAPVGTPAFVTATPSATGGWSKIKYAAQTTTKQAVKASAGTFGGYYAYNPNASVAYIQVFDVASAGVTLGTTVPDMIFGIPASSAANLEVTNGVNHATAITLACTTTATGLTAPATGLDLTIFFK